MSEPICYPNVVLVANNKSKLQCQIVRIEKNPTSSTWFTLHLQMPNEKRIYKDDDSIMYNKADVLFRNGHLSGATLYDKYPQKELGWELIGYVHRVISTIQGVWFYNTILFEHNTDLWGTTDDTIKHLMRELERLAQ